MSVTREAERRAYRDWASLAKYPENYCQGLKATMDYPRACFPWVRPAFQFPCPRPARQPEQQDWKATAHRRCHPKSLEAQSRRQLQEIRCRRWVLHFRRLR